METLPFWYPLHSLFHRDGLVDTLAFPGKKRVTLLLRVVFANQQIDGENMWGFPSVTVP